jgi:hypothetical protein
MKNIVEGIRVGQALLEIVGVDRRREYPNLLHKIKSNLKWLQVTSSSLKALD